MEKRMGKKLMGLWPKSLLQDLSTAHLLCLSLNWRLRNEKSELESTLFVFFRSQAVAAKPKEQTKTKHNFKSYCRGLNFYCVSLLVLVWLCLLVSSRAIMKY